ncbi:MAG: DnaD domain protein, partial [Oscillospiraceae bacterium]|nr:DnaD domain protein [Oscillospiraceae bacterium]
LIMGRALSTPDLIKMLGIYDHLDLPADVMMELMHFVADSSREKYGESRRPTARAFERVAQIWAEKKITDFDAAENHIRKVRERKGMEAQIREALDIRDRGFTDTESLYVAQWQDWGFGPEEIHLAYDRAVTKTGKRSLAYTNGILQNWHERKLHTLQEILEKDGPSPRTGRSVPSSGGKGIDVQKIGEIAEIMKGTGT